MKIDIVSRWDSGKVLFSFEKECNTIRLTLEAAINSGAYLIGANLSGANLRGAYLSGADLSGTDLSGAYLIGAYLSGAYLIGANLSGANLRGAYLSGTDLSGADLSGADLSGAYQLTLARHSIVPESGEFTGYKKIETSNGQIVIPVIIPADAKRVGGLAGRKCRAEFVRLTCDVDGWSNHDSDFKYKGSAGDIIRPDKFDDDIRVECTSGIHFFITKAEAEAY